MRTDKTTRISCKTKQVGLARALSKSGYCSRSRAFALIREGKVQLNGAIVRNPESPVRLGKDKIKVEGKSLEAAAKIYLVLNKPRGILTTASDEKGRDTVYGLLPPTLPWIAPVGRLDQASEGLLLFTNDSEWAARITDPDSHLEKTYHVQVNAMPDEQLLQRLRSGVEVERGEAFKAKRASRIRSGQKNSWIEIVLDEGKNRQIRRMFEGLGIEVLRLIRIAIGPLRLGSLPKGGHRYLSQEEKFEFDRWVNDRGGVEK